MTLQTEVEAGASGYSVTGGGDQGIFVKQVLKDSSAAKLFSLREGVLTTPTSGSPTGREGPGGKWAIPIPRGAPVDAAQTSPGGGHRPCRASSPGPRGGLLPSRAPGGRGGLPVRGACLTCPWSRICPGHGGTGS